MRHARLLKQIWVLRGRRGAGEFGLAVVLWLLVWKEGRVDKLLYAMLSSHR